MEDTRKDYGETRIICYGTLQDRMVVIGYTPRGPDRQIFSMRKANAREKAQVDAHVISKKKYEQVPEPTP